MSRPLLLPSLSLLTLLTLSGCAVAAGGDGDDAAADSDEQALGTSADALTRFVASPYDVRATRMGAGNSHSCALEPGGTVACWGKNSLGQLGTGTTTLQSNYAKRVVGLSTMNDLDVGNHHACAVRSSDGVVQCWGYSGSSEVGGSDGSHPVPVTVPGLNAASGLSLGTYHSCGIRQGLVRCWGSRSGNGLGDGFRVGETATPSTVLDVSDAAEVAGATCARTASGNVFCWSVRLSASETSPYHAWQTSVATYFVTLPQPAISIAAGTQHWCAVVQGGDVYCWGGSTWGQTGAIASAVTTPTRVADVSGAVKVVAGAFHSCAVLADTTVRCWGKNVTGQLGNGTIATWLPPVTVAGLSGVTSIVAADQHTCAVANGLAHCWGHNASGQLGDGTTTTRPTPVRVRWPVTIALAVTN